MFASVLQTDGKIVVGGGASPPGVNTTGSFIMARYNTNGTLDASFGVNGLVHTQIANGGTFYAMEIQPDGKIIAVGSINTPSSIIATIARYDSYGNLDSTFGTNGIVETATNPLECQFTSVGLQPDGKILAAGNTIFDSYINHTCFLLVRYLSNGSLDPSFGNNGIDTTGKLGLKSFSFGMNLLSDGKILLAGSRKDPVGGFSIARYNQNGGLDPTFGTGGMVSTAIGNPLKDLGRAMTVQQDGKILVTGPVYPIVGEPQLGLARYTADGTLDSLFGTNGIVNVDLGYNLNYGDGIVLQPDGNILVSAQWAVTDAVNKFAVARFIGGDFPVGVPVSIEPRLVKIYPNPASDYIRIETTTLLSKRNLSIYNDEGEEVLNLPETGCKMIVDISKLSNGVYYIKLTGSEGVETGRFVKIN
jgi:uncharacterized delta-60 repeat protein